MFIILRFLSL